MSQTTYTWSGGVPPVSAGMFQSDSRNWSSAAQLFFSNADNVSNDVSPVFSAMAAGDTIRVQQQTNANNWQLWTLTAPPTQEADLSWTLLITDTDSSGNNVSNNQPCDVVFTLAAPPQPPEGTLADWTLVQSDPSHWWSTVACQHGTTTSGVWTQGAIVDDRNLLTSAQPAFANHQLLLPDCDCALHIAWTPSYTPPPPPPPASVHVAPATRTQSTGTAVFILEPMHAPSWYAGHLSCPHGNSLEGVWEEGPPPPLPLQVALAAEMLHNHQRVFPDCACTFAAPGPPQASLNLVAQQGVAPSTTVALDQTPSGTLPSAFVLDAYGRVALAQAGLASITAAFFLARSIAAGGGGIAGLRLADSNTPPLAGQSVATAGFTDAGDGATTTLSYAAQLTAGTSFEVDYWNGSQLVQDVQGGSLQVTLQ